MKTNIPNIKIFPPGMVEVSHITKENANRSVLIESKLFRKYSFWKIHLGSRNLLWESNFLVAHNWQGLPVFEYNTVVYWQLSLNI